MHNLILHRQSIVVALLRHISITSPRDPKHRMFATCGSRGLMHSGKSIPNPNPHPNSNHDSDPDWISGGFRLYANPGPHRAAQHPHTECKTGAFLIHTMQDVGDHMLVRTVIMNSPRPLCANVYLPALWGLSRRAASRPN